VPYNRTRFSKWAYDLTNLGEAVRSILGGMLKSGQIGVGATVPLVFGSSSFGVPNTSFTTPSGTTLSHILDRWVPPQPAGWRLVLCNFSVTNTGAVPNEVKPGNPITIDFVSLFTATAGVGYVATAQFGGVKAAVIGDGGYAITDPLPALPNGGFVRSSVTVALGQSRPGSYQFNATAGERHQATAAVDAAKETAGSPSNAGSINGSLYGAAAVLVPWTGKPAALLLGHSILRGQDDQYRFLADPRALITGWMKRGMDDAGVSGNDRMGIGDFSGSGTTATDTMGIVPGDGKFGYRYAVLNAIRTMNGGAWPFTVVVSEHGENDRVYITDAPSWKAVMQTWWQWCKTTFPNVPLAQATLNRRAQDTLYRHTRSDTQTFSDSKDGPGPNDVRSQVQAYILSKPHPLDSVIDARAYMEDQTTHDRWPLTGYAKAGGGVITVKNSTTSYRITKGPNGEVPRVGEYLVFSPGDATLNDISANTTIQTVTDNGDGTVTVTLIGNPPKTHNVGETSSSANTSDGTHPCTALHQDAKAAPAAWKQNGMFPLAGV
jgi:hypothetical protein